VAEAIEADLPVVAAESPLARELCGEGAIYVPRASPEALADGMRRLLEGERPPPFTSEIRHTISWATHADRLAEVCVVAADPSRATKSSVTDDIGTQQAFTGIRR
jgi:glycosyltransferase involved in cell wall biosynthesis